MGKSLTDAVDAWPMLKQHLDLAEFAQNELGRSGYIVDTSEEYNRTLAGLCIEERC
jgi:hypothetical protein